jgi:glycosyltransferase involved in cell wall biosynthesis
MACLPNIDAFKRRKENRHAPTAPTADEINLFSVEQSLEIKLDGVVYTSIFNPLDGRKNWQDMISAFVWAHKTNKDATLVVKTPKLDIHDFVDPLIEFLKRFLPFDCRIVALMAFLDDSQYRALLNASTYYLNTSVAEGQCLPLMEYLSAGVPAIAPATTALADYMSPDMSFVVPAHAEPTNWQHDPRFAYRAIQYRLDWLKLVEALDESRRLAKTDPEGWRRMGAAAAERMKTHCSLDAAEARMRAFLKSGSGAPGG